MSDETPFRIDIAKLRTRNKDGSAQTMQRADLAGEELGFVDRGAKKRRGRQPSPRTGQVHAKVMPQVAEDIANESRRRGVQQGVIIEEAWALYVTSKGL